ncbi:ATP-binding protein [Sinorhizobium sp. NFACC03]|uniref:ATP-binding protein n=1 Tax=Sinorhizobium sp. NFACC03 TaxID=1566295 RepID=UPI000B80F7CD
MQRSLVQAGSPSLRRAIINLVKNAIEHAGNRGAIVVRVERNGVIEICDDGPGVPEAAILPAEAAASRRGPRSQSRAADCAKAWCANDRSEFARRRRMLPHGLR